MVVPEVVDVLLEIVDVAIVVAVDTADVIAEVSDEGCTPIIDSEPF